VGSQIRIPHDEAGANFRYLMPIKSPVLPIQRQPGFSIRSVRAMSYEQNKQTAVRFFAEQDRQHGPLAADLCAADYQAEIAGFPPMDREGHSQFGAMFYRAFPNLHHRIEETVAEDDKVTVHFTLHGAQTGDFAGIPPTGRDVTVPAIAILNLREGKVYRLRAVFDQMGLMRQLGALPA
jgi:steroid delta-isomerase-like uncharacterized protein